MNERRQPGLEARKRPVQEPGTWAYVLEGLAVDGRCRSWPDFRAAILRLTGDDLAEFDRIHDAVWDALPGCHSNSCSRCSAIPGNAVDRAITKARRMQQRKRQGA